MVHNHNDEPNVGGSGRHASEPYAAAWSRILQRHPDALLYPTYAGGGPHANVRERYAHIDELRLAGLLRMPLLDLGTVNFDGLDPSGSPGTGDGVYQTTFGDVRWMMNNCREYRLSPSISIFEPGWLRLALAYHARGELPRGTTIKPVRALPGRYRHRPSRPRKARTGRKVVGERRGSRWLSPGPSRDRSPKKIESRGYMIAVSR